MSLFKKQCFILLNPDQEFFQVEDDFWDLKLNLRFSVYTESPFNEIKTCKESF